jgi:hypothetical protein
VWQLAGWTTARWEADFALGALMEVPDQYATIIRMGMLGNCPARAVTATSVSLLRNKHAKSPNIPGLAQGVPVSGQHVPYV